VEIYVITFPGRRNLLKNKHVIYNLPPIWWD